MLFSLPSGRGKCWPFSSEASFSPCPVPFGGPWSSGRCVFRSWPLRRTSCPSAQLSGPRLHFSQGRFGPRSLGHAGPTLGPDARASTPVGLPPGTPVRRDAAASRLLPACKRGGPLAGLSADFCAHPQLVGLVGWASSGEGDWSCMYAWNFNA